MVAKHSQAEQRREPEQTITSNQAKVSQDFV
jgi:hypothetical protein